MTYQFICIKTYKAKYFKLLDIFRVLYPTDSVDSVETFNLAFTDVFCNCATRNGFSKNQKNVTKT